jgi:hypothetical protein
MRSVQLVADWKEWLLAQASPLQELVEQAAEKARLIERPHRARQL